MQNVIPQMRISSKMCALQPKCKCKCDLSNAHLLQNKCALQPKCKCKCKCDPRICIPNITLDFVTFRRDRLDCHFEMAILK